jgi:hypothetical protein
VISHSCAHPKSRFVGKRHFPIIAEFHFRRHITGRSSPMSRLLCRCTPRDRVFDTSLIVTLGGKPTSPRLYDASSGRGPSDTRVLSEVWFFPWFASSQNKEKIEDAKCGYLNRLSSRKGATGPKAGTHSPKMARNFRKRKEKEILRVNGCRRIGFGGSPTRPVLCFCALCLLLLRPPPTPTETREEECGHQPTVFHQPCQGCFIYLLLSSS